MSAKTPTNADILKLETSYWDAMKAKDGNRTAELSGETSVVTGSQGVVSIAKEKMGEMTERGDWELLSYEFDDVEVSIPTPDVAIIGYKVRQKVKLKGKEQDLHAVDSSTWLRSENGWQCYAHSETILSDDKAA